MRLFNPTAPIHLAAFVAAALAVALVPDAQACGRRGNGKCSTSTAAGGCGQQVQAVAFQAPAAPTYPVQAVTYDTLPAGYFQLQAAPQAACANGSCAAPAVVRYRR